MKKLQFKNQELTFDAQLYIKSKDHVMRFLAWDGQCQFVATVYIPGLTGREVAINNYGENEGIEQALIEQGFLEQNIKRIEESRHGNINVYNLSLEALKQYEEDPEDVELNEEAEANYPYDQNRYVVHSPDGFTFEREQEPYSSLTEAFIGIKKFVERFRKQGYYSTRYDRIHLSEIPPSCTIFILYPDGSDELMGTEEWIELYEFFKDAYQIIYDTVKKEFDEEKYHTNHALPATNEAINSKEKHRRAFYAATDPNDRGGTGHGDMSFSDAVPGM